MRNPVAVTMPRDEALAAKQILDAQARALEEKEGPLADDARVVRLMCKRVAFYFEKALAQGGDDA